MNDPILHTRREFVRTGLLGGSLAWTAPSFVAATMHSLHAAQDGAAVAGATGRDAPILVVLQLAGGNDGLNTVVPTGNDLYYRARSQLAQSRKSCLRIDDEHGFHPALTGFKDLLEAGRLAVVQGVGYPNPNRSHFRSMEIWHTASDADRVEKYGWIGRYFDHQCAGSDPEVGVSLGGVAPQAFTGGAGKGVTFQDPARFQFRGEGDEAMTAMQAPAGENDGGSIAMSSGRASTVMVADPLDFLERVALDTRVASDRIQALLKKPFTPAAYPATRLATDLRSVSRLIAGGLGTRVFYVSHGGYDTHANQAGTHERLLRELGDALKAFQDDLDRHGHADRVTTLVFSEFGRRVKENASGGTDHGAAAPAFVVGPRLRPGLHGSMPSLAAKDLDQGDLRHSVDFRQVYATMLEKVLGIPSAPVLGRSFAPLDILRA